MSGRRHASISALLCLRSVRGSFAINLLSQIRKSVKQEYNGKVPNGEDRNAGGG